MGDIFPMIIKNLVKQLKSKNIKVKVQAMKTFAQLSVMEESHEKFLRLVIPYIQASISEANNDMIVYSLQILKEAFKYDEPQKVSITAQEQSEAIGQFLT